MKLPEFWRWGNPVNHWTCRAAFLALALAPFTAAAATPQNPASQATSQESGAEAKKTPAKSDNVKLLDATRVSTEEAARHAAQKKAEASPKNDSKKKEDTKKDAVPGITELQPAAKPQDDSTPSVETEAQKTGKLPIKDIHGSVQGGGGSGVREGGAEVGASSKGGKTHVYVESERSSTQNPTPH